MLAKVSNAIVIGFNVRPNPKVRDLATEQNVDIRFYNVIYNVVNDIKGAMAGLMEPTYEERVMGRAEVRQTFNISRVGTVAGCYVTEGRIERGQPARLLRDGVVVYDGKIGSLRRFKDDVKEVQTGYECGIGIENFNDIKVDDVIECYEIEEIKPIVE
jgi:translation initiation factor IF-2